MQSFSCLHHKGVPERLHTTDIAPCVGKTSAKGQMAVGVTWEISSQRALLSAVLEEAGIYSCSPTDLKAGSKYQAFCSDYREPPSVEMIYCFPASHYSGGWRSEPRWAILHTPSQSAIYIRAELWVAFRARGRKSVSLEIFHKDQKPNSDLSLLVFLMILSLT